MNITSRLKVQAIAIFTMWVAYFTANKPRSRLVRRLGHETLTGMVQTVVMEIDCMVEPIPEVKLIIRKSLVTILAETE